MPTAKANLCTFTGEIVTTKVRKYAVFEGEWSWGNRAWTSAGSLRNALTWEIGQQREESLKALTALTEAEHVNA